MICFTLNYQRILKKCQTQSLTTNLKCFQQRNTLAYMAQLKKINRPFSFQSHYNLTLVPIFFILTTKIIEKFVKFLIVVQLAIMPNRFLVLHYTLLTQKYSKHRKYFIQNTENVLFFPIYMQSIYEVVRYGKNKRLYSTSCGKIH